MTKCTPDKLCDVYIDESSQQHQFLVLGAVVVSTDGAAGVTDLIKKARLPELPKGETKWGKVSKAKLAAYKRLVDVLFDNGAKIQFHCIVLDTHRFDHAKFNEGDRDIGFNKEIYQLAMKAARQYGDRFFHLYPDFRTTRQDPEDLRVILNRGCSKKGYVREEPFQRCQFRRSKEVLLLQLTDIIAGAIAYRLNGHDKAADACPAKIELMKHIFARAGISDITKDTAMHGIFTVWHRKLK